ncbi:MAG: hypothetical protein R3305_08015, partial [Gammaproteobacteria bacterium]|nr:hypothetical protein [Gammaproteobacteria bacterium]
LWQDMDRNGRRHTDDQATAPEPAPQGEAGKHEVIEFVEPLQDDFHTVSAVGDRKIDYMIEADRML